MTVTNSPSRVRRVSLALVAILVAGAAGVLHGGAQATATPGVDDYPYQSHPWSQVDPWGFYKRECTSFVAWRLNNDNGLPFTNNGHGNAGNWGIRAQQLGYPVNMSPAPGAVAWWGYSASMPFGHVAWVHSVSGGNVVVEEYNWNNNHNYHTRSIPAGSVSGYIHYKDIVVAPPPPPGDFDADGVSDANDWCPYVKGTAANRGCPNSVTQVSGDLNGDGKDDIIAVSRGLDNSPGLSWFESTSGASASVADPVGLGLSLPAPAWNVDGLKWAAGDFNGDGKDDLMAASGSGSGAINMYLFLSTGSGLSGPVLVKQPPHPGWQWSRVEYLTGDFDGDGKDDIYAISRGPSDEPYLNWFRSTATGMSASLADGALLKTRPAPWWNVDNLKWATGDFDGNGRDDLFAASGAQGSGPAMYIFASDGTTLADPVNVASPNPAYWLWDRLTFMSADLDGDDKDDIVYVSRALDNAPNLGWFRSSAPAAMSPSLAAPVGFALAMSAPAWNVSNLKWAVGDHNGDGKDGIFVTSGHNGNELGMYLLTAAGSGATSTLNNPAWVKDPNPQFWHWWRLHF